MKNRTSKKDGRVGEARSARAGVGNRIGVLVAALLLGTAAGRASADGAAVGWMAYPYNLTMPEEEYQRILHHPDIEYIGLQLYPASNYDNEQTRQRIAELKAAGKKMIVDIWFGEGPPFSWERYNFPNIALDSAIRKEFFARAIDPMLDYLGYANLYAVHLLEETGMQFAWDANLPGRPDRDDDGLTYGCCYDNPPNWIQDRCISGPNVITIRKYNDRFRKDTGLDMRYYPIWGEKEMQRYKDWVQTTMEAGAHIEFARHIHRKYPGLRVYAFNSGPALIPQSKVLDGQFSDPYSSALGVYFSLRTLRTVMRSDEELVCMVWGNREKPPAERLPQQAACYMAGGNVLSTFADDEHKDDRWLNIVRNSVKPFIGLPVFRSKANVLVPGDWTSCASLGQIGNWITGFARYDVYERWSEDFVSLKPYDLVVSWGTWHRDLPEWVRAGGVLMATIPGWGGGWAMLPPNDFLVQEGFLGEPEKVGRITVDYQPDAWMRQNLKLREMYKLELDSAFSYSVKKTDLVHRDRFLYVVKYGKGLIVLLPASVYIHPPWEQEAHWESYRQLLTDLCRGALIHMGKTDAANEGFDDPEKGNDYLMATSDDGRFTVYILMIDMHGPNKSPTSFIVPGKDRISGRTDVRLCHENPVVMIDHGEAQ